MPADLEIIDLPLRRHEDLLLQSGGRHVVDGVTGPGLLILVLNGEQIPRVGLGCQHEKDVVEH